MMLAVRRSPATASGWIDVHLVGWRALLPAMRDTPQFHFNAPDCYTMQLRDNMINLLRHQRRYCRARRDNLPAAVIAQCPPPGL